ncbi:MAG TPA: DUF4062 domain-containing protein [Polyangiaceae bacterium]|nr:DUF4062 domain-containing protein [Polyangiaceae bacterium]
MSSTFSDLHQERQAVLWELLKLRHIPAGMESFPATDDRGWQIIQRTIDDSDFYVLLVAGRYGSIDPTTGLSWTEREYDYARTKGIPILAFVRDSSAITADKFDTGRLGESLSIFRQKVSLAHLHATWAASQDLVLRVVQSITVAIQDLEEQGMPRPGWVRGGAALQKALQAVIGPSEEDRFNSALSDTVIAIAKKYNLDWTRTTTFNPIGKVFYFRRHDDVGRLYDLLVLDAEALKRLEKIWQADADFSSVVEALMFAAAKLDEADGTPLEIERRLEGVLNTISFVGLAALSDAARHNSDRTQKINPRPGGRIAGASATRDGHKLMVELNEATLNDLLAIPPLERNGEAYQRFLAQLESQGFPLAEE